MNGRKEPALRQSRPSKAEQAMTERGVKLLTDICDHPDSLNVNSAKGIVLSRVRSVLDGHEVVDLHRLMVVAGYQPDDADAILTALHNSDGLRAFEEYLEVDDERSFRIKIETTLKTPAEQLAAIAYLEADEEGRRMFKHKGYSLTQGQIAYLNTIVNSRDSERVIGLLYDLS